MKTLRDLKSSGTEILHLAPKILIAHVKMDIEGWEYSVSTLTSSSLLYYSCAYSCVIHTVYRSRPRGRERIFFERTTSDRKLKASREGSK